jgi:hypothetical protein
MNPLHRLNVPAYDIHVITARFWSTDRLCTIVAAAVKRFGNDCLNETEGLAVYFDFAR